jgi:serine/threonine-protein kinase
LLKVSHYRLLKQLGGGGTSDVYLAEDTNLHRKVALKLLHRAYTQDAQQLQRFHQEAEWMSMLSHPSILTVFEVGEAEGIHFIAAEFIDGMTLRKRLAAGALPLREALDIAISVAAALRVAHEAWIVHRDIKPENIMLYGDGYVKILDFGVAKLTEPHNVRSITKPRMVLGTLQYLAPEQVRAIAVDPRTDIWALGVVFYEMLAGNGPFASNSIVELFEAITNGTPPSIQSQTTENIPLEVEAIVNRAMMKEPEERYQTVEPMLKELKEAREELVYRERMEKHKP